jgi:hypothetical protein
VLPHNAYPDHAGLATGFVAKDSRAPAKPEQRVVAVAVARRGGVSDAKAIASVMLALPEGVRRAIGAENLEGD